MSVSLVEDPVAQAQRHVAEAKQHIARDSLADRRTIVFEKPPAGDSAQINSSRARIASSRITCNLTIDVIHETVETVERSLEMLNSKPKIDPWQLTEGEFPPS
jgi:hypothetical protein